MSTILLVVVSFQVNFNSGGYGSHIAKKVRFVNKIKMRFDFRYFLPYTTILRTSTIKVR